MRVPSFTPLSSEKPTQTTIQGSMKIPGTPLETTGRVPITTTEGQPEEGPNCKRTRTKQMGRQLLLQLRAERMCHHFQ